jgi:hypothetical protein
VYMAADGMQAFTAAHSIAPQLYVASRSGLDLRETGAH